MTPIEVRTNYVDWIHVIVGYFGLRLINVFEPRMLHCSGLSALRYGLLFGQSCSDQSLFAVGRRVFLWVSLVSLDRGICQHICLVARFGLYQHQGIIAQA